VSLTWVDGGYNTTVIRHGAQRGIHVEVVKRPTGPVADCVINLVGSV
jgi:hypothetical protein